MKLVATSDFRNPDPETIDIGNDRVHDFHISKGARFQIGQPDQPFEKLTGPQKKLVVELNAAGRIVEESQKDKVAQIDKEVADEKRKASPAAKK